MSNLGCRKQAIASTAPGGGRLYRARHAGEGGRQKPRTSASGAPPPRRLHTAFRIYSWPRRQSFRAAEEGLWFRLGVRKSAKRERNPSLFGTLARMRREKRLSRVYDREAALRALDSLFSRRACSAFQTMTDCALAS